MKVTNQDPMCLGTQWGQCGSESAADGAKDVVSVMVVAREPADLTVVIGGREHFIRAQGPTPLSYFEIPFDHTMTGPVILVLNGKVTYGPEIKNQCDEHVSARLFNVIEISRTSANLDC